MDIFLSIKPAWFSVAGIVLDIVGAIVLGSALLLKDDDIEKRAGTYWDENPHIAPALRADRRKGQIGLGLLVAGFLLQLIGQWPR